MGTQTRNFNTQTRNSNMYKLHVFVSLALVASTVALYTPERVASEEQSLDKLADADKQTMAPEMEDAGADIEVVDFSDLEMEGQDQDQPEETRPATLSKPGVCVPEYGVYYLGFNRDGYKRINNVPTWEACGRACNSNRACVKWKFWHAGHANAGRRNTCWLQDMSYTDGPHNAWSDISGGYDCYVSKGSV